MLANYNQRMRVALASGVLVLVFSLVATYQAFRSQLAAFDLSQHTLVVLTHTGALQSALLDAETGTRGFLITGAEVHLQPFASARSAVPRLLAQLKDLTADNPHQRPRLETIEKKSAERLVLLEQLVAVRRSHGAATVMPVELVDAGKTVMDGLRALIAEMESEENQLLAERVAAVARNSRYTLVAIVLGNALAIGLVLLAAFVTRREMISRAQSEMKLAESVGLLTASNRELEQFAYVASHDLQEPLRMVANYCELLRRRYRSKLDADADEFIGFAVDGARRMQILIDDLLTYSRVGRLGEKLVPIETGAALQAALQNLETAIASSGAVISHDPLPVALGDLSQLGQLWQNLLGNALKFHGPEAPRIHVSVAEKGDHWLFGVRDNGIGIAPEYREQIFRIFQRLHSKEEYPGTGIGLAICKKIVERHGGIIWVESSPGAGTTFYFTIPRKAPSLPAPHP